MAKKNKLGYFNPSRIRYVDADYIDDLSPEELEWYIKFCQEYYDQKFSKDIEERLDKRDSAYKESYTRDNAARRDVMNQWYGINGEYDLGDVLVSPIRRIKKLTNAHVIKKMLATLKKLGLAA